MHVLFAPPSVQLGAPSSFAITCALLAAGAFALARSSGAVRARRRLRIALPIALAVSIALVGATRARAQGEGEGDGEGQPQADPAAEVIKIKGQRTDVQKQDQQIAITSFGQEQLDQLGVSDVASLQQNVPSLHIGQSGTQAVVTLRGVGINNLSLTGSQGVLVHQDGIALGRPTVVLGAFYDIEAVNALRGPQGTQGGINSTGGWIEINSIKPSEEFQAEADYQIGSYNEHIVRGFINSPIVDEMLMVRVTGRYERHQGYQRGIGRKAVGHRQETLFWDDDDAWDNANNLLARVQARGLLGNFEYHLTGQHAFRKGNGPAQHLLTEPGTLAQTGSNVGLGPAPDDPNTPGIDERLSGLPDDPSTPIDESLNYVRTGLWNRFPRTSTDPRATYRDFPGGQDIEQWFARAFFAYDIDTSPLGPVRAELLWAFNRTRVDVDFDSDLTDADAISVFTNALSDQYSAEFKLRSRDQSPLNWMIGAIWWQEKTDTEAFVDLSGGNSATDFGILNGIETDHLSGFAETTYDLTEAFKLGAGVRWSEDTKDLAATRQNVNLSVDPNSGGSLPPTLEFLPTIRLEEPFQAVTYKAFGRWQLTDQSSLSLSYTTGFKPGGFPLGQDCALSGAGNTGSTDKCASYGAEKVRQVELTSKNYFFDQRMMLNTTLFWTDYDPFQVCFVLGIDFKCEDNGDALVRGFEIEWQVFPTPELSLIGNFNLLDAKIDNFRLADPGEPNQIPGTTIDNPKAGVQQDLSGNPLPRSPKYNLNFVLRYEIDTTTLGLPAWGKVAPQVQYTYQSRTTFREWDTPQYDQRRTHHVNLRISWISQDTRWRAEAFIDNITDLDKRTFVSFGVQGSVQAQYAPPRRAGIKLGYSF